MKKHHSQSQHIVTSVGTLEICRRNTQPNLRKVEKARNLVYLMPELGLDGQITVCLNELGEKDFPRQKDLSIQCPWDMRECGAWKGMQMIQHKPGQRVKELAWGWEGNGGKRGD